MEAEVLLPQRGLCEIGTGYMELAAQWDVLAESMWQLGETGETELLGQMSQQIFDLYESEKLLLHKLQAAVHT